MAGALAGSVGLAVFLTAHAAWIVPIWSVVGIGVPVAVLGGAAAGWALEELRAVLPRSLVAAWLAVTVGAGLVLAPSVVLTVAVGPSVVADDLGRPVLTAPLSVVAARFVVELLVVTALSGAVLGWLLTRRRRAALATGAAALAFALGPAHNNPFVLFTGVPEATRTGLLIQAAVIATASAVLVALDRRFTTVRPRPG